MAEQTQTALSAPFPAPPPFYQHFTGQNLNSLRHLRKQAAHEGTSTAESNFDILSLPPELRYLLPPPPPAETYTSFGATLSLSAADPTLSESGIEQLYPSSVSATQNPQAHLIALTRSLMTTFLSLTGILSQQPTLYAEKVADLRTIMLNVHDLINQYRPHQARESLILIMEDRVERMKAEVAGVREAREKVAALMGRLTEVGNSPEKAVEDGTVHGVERGAVEDDERRRRARQREAWAAIEREMADGS